MIAPHGGWLPSVRPWRLYVTKILLKVMNPLNEPLYR